MTTFIKSGPPITESDISVIENKYNFILPREYRAFLLNINGGIPSKRYYVNEKLDYSYVIDLFLSIRANNLSFEEYYEDYKIQSKLLPERMVPIAEDAFGNLICVSIKGEDTGSIYFWNHEDNSTDVRRIAPSFNEFLNNLKDHS